jgi:hypothetical protein
MRGRPELPLPQGTPIFDALTAEFRQAYRTLPGDRTGEEGFRFAGFAPWTDGSEVGLAPGGAEGSALRRHEYASRRPAGPGGSPPGLHNAATQPALRMPPPGAPGRHRFALPPGRG